MNMVFFKRSFDILTGKVNEMVAKIDNMLNYHKKIEDDIQYLKEKTDKLEDLLIVNQTALFKEIAEMKKATLEIAKASKVKTTKSK